jgi:5-formyltetrahydrofolate cyclo-ligase
MDKNTLRKICLKRLKSSPKAGRYAKDKQLSKRIARLIWKHEPKSILFYLPLAMEVDLMGLLGSARKKVKVLVPFVEGESFKMVQYRYPLERNSFGILEPKAHNLAVKNVDMIIVPVVAMDGKMQRVGFGKGMYDRFYDSLYKKPIVIFVQRESCKSRKALCDVYDIRGDYYLSSKERQSNRVLS